MNARKCKWRIFAFCIVRFIVTIIIVLVNFKISVEVTSYFLGVYLLQRS